MKGFAIAALGGIAITFIVVAIILSFGADILGDIRTDQLITNTGSVTIESFTANATLANLRIINDSTWLIRNKTVTYIQTIDYHIDFTTSVIRWVNTTADTQLINATYTYLYDEHPYEYNVSGSGLASVQKLGDWLPTIALVIIASVIIAIIMMYLGGKRNLA